MKEKCPTCSMPVYRDRRSVTFSSGNSPIVTFEAVIDAEWCSRPNCYQQIELRNCADHIRGDFVNAVLLMRDAIRPIADGVIERGRAKSQYDFAKGTRKTTLKDARAICAFQIERINKAINRFTETIF